MTTPAPWLDAEPIICPFCNGPCTEEPEATTLLYDRSNALDNSAIHQIASFYSQFGSG